VFTKTAWQHLRLRFSFLLMPVFLLSVCIINIQQISFLSNHFYFVAIAFVVWHLFIYPASNAYNSFQDRDEGSIGDIEIPLKVDNSVFKISLLFNALGLVLACFAGLYFFMFVLVYVIFSTLYSYRKIRLKKFPIIGFLTIFFFQGFWVFLSIFTLNQTLDFSNQTLLLALASSFIFGGGYPITQIYQHQQDKKDGVKTISMLLGIRGTLIFSGLMFLIGFATLNYYLIVKFNWVYALSYAIILLPALIYFNKWAISVFKNPINANFKNVMRMTWINALCNNFAFLLFLFQFPIYICPA